MDRKNSSNKIIIYSVITLFVISILAWALKLSYKKTAKEPNIARVQEEKEAALSIGARVVEIDGRKKIAVFITPIKDFTLSAFSLKAKVFQEGLSPNIELEKNKKLSDAAWSFPIMRVAEDQSKSGEIAVEIAGFRLGNSPFHISKETGLVYLPIDAKKAGLPVTIEVDKTKTVFYASDAVTKVYY